MLIFQIFCAVGTTVYLFATLIIGESARWLLNIGKTDKAIEVKILFYAKFFQLSSFFNFFGKKYCNNVKQVIQFLLLRIM